MLALAVHLAVLLVLPPFLLGVVSRTKAWFAGRAGPPLLQPYHDLLKLLRKGTVYSPTTTWVFRAAPVVAVATALTAGLLLPVGGGEASAPLHFPGDLAAFASLLALARFFTLAAALDTGSAFAGMGASRDAAVAALAEPALALALGAALARTHSLSLGEALAAFPGATWAAGAPAVLLAALALGVVLLAENARVPVDDPATHLELTMIHEATVLEYGGPDLAFLEYARAVKLFLFATLFTRFVLPVPASPAAGVGVVLLGVLAVATLVGAVESSVARLRLGRVPQFLVSAWIVGALGVVLLFFSSRDGDAG